MSKTQELRDRITAAALRREYRRRGPEMLEAWAIHCRAVRKYDALIERLHELTRREGR